MAILSGIQTKYFGVIDFSEQELRNVGGHHILDAHCISIQDSMKNLSQFIKRGKTYKYLIMFKRVA